VKQINVAERHRAHGVAVIRAFEGKKFWVGRGYCGATFCRECAREFVSQLERDFQCRRAVVGKENLLPIWICDLRLTRQSGYWIGNRVHGFN
jgi:hypothetical protein